MVKSFFVVYLLLNYVTRGRKREMSLWSVPYIHTGCYDGLVSRAIFAANSCEYHIRKVWKTRRIQIWRIFSRFQQYLCRYLYVQTRHLRILQSHLSLWFLSDVLIRRENNTTFRLVHLYEFLWGCPVVLCDLRDVGDTRLLPHHLHWLSGPCRALSSYKFIFQAPVSLAIVLGPVTPIFFRLFPPSSKHSFLFLISKASCRVHNPHIPCTNKQLIILCGNKMPTRCNRGFYCRSYCLLNMFRASLCPSSGAQEYYTVVAACGILCCGFFK